MGLTRRLAALGCMVAGMLFFVQIPSTLAFAHARAPTSIFFELGLNQGQTLETLLNENDFAVDRNLISPQIRAVQGGRRFAAHEFCIHGFEANPDFEHKLLSIEHRVRMRGGCMRLNVPAIAGLKAGRMPFWIDHRSDMTHGINKTYWSEGSTMDPISAKRLIRPQKVEIISFDFASYLEQHVLAMRRRAFKGGTQPTTAILRMDIEGGEYTLLPHLLAAKVTRPRSGLPVSQRDEHPERSVLCLLDLLIVELHAKRVPLAIVNLHERLSNMITRECPHLTVRLDPANYCARPWMNNPSWPWPPEWKADGIISCSDVERLSHP